MGPDKGYVKPYLEYLELWVLVWALVVGPCLILFVLVGFILWALFGIWRIACMY